jgi:hypothetical protein
MMRLSYLVVILWIALWVLSCTEDPENSDSTEKSPETFGLLDGTGGFGGSSSGNGDSVQPAPVEPGQITAAEWNDLNEWDFWLNLGQNEEFNLAQENWKFYLTKRYSFLVTDNHSNPLIDCELELKKLNGDLLWKARTDNEGKAELWLNTNEDDDASLMAVISYLNQKTTLVDPKPYGEGTNEVMIAFEGTPVLNADILFVVDATGSMSDEIEFLKSELLDVIARARNMNSGLSLRVGSVFYRDEGDEYLTRVSPFSSNLHETLAFINNQNANGGGDYEEAVHTALNTAITQLSWSADARARLLFLVLDAPPHHEDPIVNDISDIIAQSAEKGIKIIPIAASGINKDTEFLFRFFALATNGTYVFITNDSGIGEDHIEATVGDYQIEMLNDLIVRLITKYTF